jgi:hypothetical protein
MDATFYVMVKEGGGGGIRKKPSQVTEKRILSKVVKLQKGKKKKEKEKRSALMRGFEPRSARINGQDHLKTSDAKPLHHMRWYDGRNLRLWLYQAQYNKSN